MRTDHHRGLSVFFLLVLALAMGSSSSEEETMKIGFPLRKWHVHVYNGMGVGQLFLHCKSEDNDLGRQNLEVGQDLSWSFKENFLGTTLYWCYMLKDDKSHATFDVFWMEKDNKWLSYRCNWNNCIWIAKDDGIYLRVIPENREDFVHKWEI